MSRTQDLHYLFRIQRMLNVGHPSIQMLDFYFPFLVFFYGLAINFILEIPYLVALARKEMPSHYATLEKHRKIAVFSLYVGGLWSLQNIWFS